MRIRDSKLAAGPVVTVGPGAWAAFAGPAAGRAAYGRGPPRRSPAATRPAVEPGRLHGLAAPSRSVSRPTEVTRMDR
ncbi:DUF397 domain-containing protein [[Kitasatospora] papulosa]|uniref:DUF397 domain-containing protein n=1 Tax=[Kitasatospora] papulosa TaxID=1464011 RepID=UPI003800CECA